MLLEDLVKSTVSDFVTNSLPFTALDISNKVKETMPEAKHYEVRDLVKNMYSTYIMPSGYDTSNITVNLQDGSETTAILYHHASDIWDLDAKYDKQKRSQVSYQPPAIDPKPADADFDEPNHLEHDRKHTLNSLFDIMFKMFKKNQ